MAMTARNPAKALRMFAPRTVADRRAALTAVLETWAARRRSRIALANLGEHHLRDIGLDRGIRETEIHKPFWR